MRFGMYGSEACVYLFAADHVAWSATLAGGSGWLSIASGASGTGSGLITLKAEQSTVPERSAQLTVVAATGPTLLECAAIQATAETLATLNTSVLQVPFPTVPDVMELGILGKWAAQEIAKVPEPFTAIVLAIALLVVQLIGALAIALRSALSPLVPEPLTWFGAPGLYDALTKVLPATAVFIQEETDLLTLYLPIQVASGGK